MSFAPPGGVRESPGQRPTAVRQMTRKWPSHGNSKRSFATGTSSSSPCPAGWFTSASCGSTGRSRNGAKARRERYELTPVARAAHSVQAHCGAQEDQRTPPATPRSERRSLGQSSRQLHATLRKNARGGRRPSPLGRLRRHPMPLMLVQPQQDSSRSEPEAFDLRPTSQHTSQVLFDASPHLRRIARAVAKSPWLQQLVVERVQDALSDAVLRGAAPKKLRAWLTVTARRQAAAALRQRRISLNTTALHDCQSRASSSESSRCDRQRQALSTAIDSLGPRDRGFVLAWLRNGSAAQSAVECGTNKANVHRALRRVVTLAQDFCPQTTPSSNCSPGTLAQAKQHEPRRSS